MKKIHPKGFFDFFHPDPNSQDIVIRKIIYVCIKGVVFYFFPGKDTEPHTHSLSRLAVFFFPDPKKKYRKSQKGVSEWLSIFSREKIKYDTFAGRAEVVTKSVEQERRVYTVR